MTIFKNDFENKEDIIYEFKLHKNDLDVCDIIYANYEYENYNGDALVIFTKNGDLYEVNAGHCSCFGLEGQWDPELTTWKALEKVLTSHSKYSSFATECLQDLKSYFNASKDI